MGRWARILFVCIQFTVGGKSARVLIRFFRTPDAPTRLFFHRPRTYMRTLNLTPE